MQDALGELVITGCGVFGAVGANCAELSDRLQTANLDHLTRRTDPRVLEPWIAGIMPDPDPETAAKSLFDDDTAKKVRRLTRAAANGPRAGLTAALEAWQDAALPMGPVMEDASVFVAGQNTANEVLLPASEAFTNDGRLSAGRLMQMGHDSFLVSLLSAVFGIAGDGAVVGGAQASGHIAILQAVRALRSGETELALVVGAPTILSPLEVAGYQALGALANGSEDTLAAGCRAFDTGAAGFVPTEAAAALVLETAAHAQARNAKVKARISGWASAMHRSVEPGPDCATAVRVMRNALAMAGARKPDMVSAHATGTPAGDSAEAEALAAVVGARTPVTAPKAILGHGLTSAGVLETVAAIVQMEQGFLHGSPGLLEPVAPLLDHVRERRDCLSIGRVLNNGFGFGGFNAAIVLDQPDLGA